MIIKVVVEDVVKAAVVVVVNDVVNRVEAKDVVVVTGAVVVSPHE